MTKLFRILFYTFFCIKIKVIHQIGGDLLENWQRILRALYSYTDFNFILTRIVQKIFHDFCIIKRNLGKTATNIEKNVIYFELYIPTIPKISFRLSEDLRLPEYVLQNGVRIYRYFFTVTEYHFNGSLIYSNQFLL